MHSVPIVDGRVPHACLLEIFTKEGVGTQILCDKSSNPMQ
ncbi:Acetylglutamate kinase [Moraxella catarrhalis]|nr:Acetylglutamate kinase [Moraxella catarrhalis]OAV07113.1 Acetylglutamate kinase [Moraxella catarrhalis]